MDKEEQEFEEEEKVTLPPLPEKFDRNFLKNLSPSQMILLYHTIIPQKIRKLEIPLDKPKLEDILIQYRNEGTLPQELEEAAKKTTVVFQPTLSPTSEQIGTTSPTRRKEESVRRSESPLFEQEEPITKAPSPRVTAISESKGVKTPSQVLKSEVLTFEEPKEKKIRSTSEPFLPSEVPRTTGLRPSPKASQTVTPASKLPQSKTSIAPKTVPRTQPQVEVPRTQPQVEVPRTQPQVEVPRTQPQVEVPRTTTVAMQEQIEPKARRNFPTHRLIELKFGNPIETGGFVSSPTPPELLQHYQRLSSLVNQEIGGKVLKTRIYSPEKIELVV